MAKIPNVDMNALASAMGSTTEDLTAAYPKLAGLLKGSGKIGAFKGIAGGLLVYLLLDKIMGSAQKASDTGFQGQMLKERTEAMSPDAILYQALSQQAGGERQMATDALMRQLLGVTGPSLARGETLIR